MSRKTTPDVEAQAVILREAGYSLPTIAAHLDLSLSTTKRIIKRRGAVVGASTGTLIEQARETMFASAFELETTRARAASLATEDLTLAGVIREKIMETLQSLDPTTSSPYQMMRTTVAAATALDLTQKVSRRALPLDRIADAAYVSELPELRITVMTEEDVRTMREQQRKEAAERITGNPQTMEEIVSEGCDVE